MSPLSLFKSFGLTTEVIEHNHIIFYTEWVQDSKQVAMNDACVIRRLLLPLSPKIENLWGPHIQHHAERTQEFLPHANGVSGLWRVGNLDKKKHKWPYKITRACVCACYFNISELSSNPIALALKPQQLKAVYLWRIYPPKLSNMIISSSTPSEWSKSSTVFDIIGGPQR